MFKCQVDSTADKHIHYLVFFSENTRYKGAIKLHFGTDGKWQRDLIGRSTLWWNKGILLHKSKAFKVTLPSSSVLEKGKVVYMGKKKKENS